MSGTPFEAELIETANKIACPGKGILAADESIGTIGKRFEKIKVENNRDNRRAYRQLLFEAKGVGEFISGVIMYEETLLEKTPDGRDFVDLLKAEGIVPGIKVDKGQADIMGTNGETSTMGLDGLAERCKEYYKKGARFAKWRAVILIDPSKGHPSPLGIQQQVDGLARYASICQQNGLVPIVEPEVLMDGPHDIQEAARVTELVWAEQIACLHRHKVMLEGILLKPNFVRTGAENPNQASLAEVAAYTLRTLQRTCPCSIPGVNFLSGGMSEEEATVALNELNKCPGKKPWNLSFSYGRALQSSVLKAWQGKEENIPKAQAELMLRAKANGWASMGKYNGEAAGGLAAAQSSFVKNYTY